MTVSEATTCARRERRGKRAPGQGTVVQRGDGRWMAATFVLDDEGKPKRRFLYGKTQAEVVAKLDAARERTRKGVPVPAERETLKAFLTRWVEARSNIRPRTRASYKWLIEKHIVPELGAVKLARLTIGQVESFLAAKRRSGLSARTTQYLLVVLRMALAKAEREGLVGRNVARLAEGQKVERHEAVPLTMEQTRSFLKALSGDRHEALFVVLAARGLRLGEALALRWSNLDLESASPSLRVTHTLQRIGKAWELAPPKSKTSLRTMRLSASIVDALRRHRARQAEERLAAGSMWEDHGLVFATPIGRPLDQSNVRREFYAVLERAKLPRRRVHDLRHGAATMLLEQGENLKQVSAALGHSRISTTADVYAHVIEALDERGSDRMERALFVSR